MNRKTAIAALGLLAAACGKPEGFKPEAVPTVRGVGVEVMRPLAVRDVYEAVGTVRSCTTAVLSTKVMGTVVAVPVREGDRVRAGQVLVEIDSRDTQTQVEKARAGIREATEGLEEVDRATGAADQAVIAAQANRKLAAATYARFDRLIQRQAVSQQEFDEVEARTVAATAEAARAAEMRETLVAKRKQILAKRDQALADLSNAQLYVGYARVTAPAAGVVAAKTAEVGTLAAPGVPLITLEDALYRLEASVEDSRVAHLRVGDRVPVRIEAAGTRELEGRVSEIAPVADPATRSLTVKIDLPPGLGLRSGLFGRALFPAGEHVTLTVPCSAVVEQGQLTGVWALDAGNTAHLRLITVGKARGDRLEVLSGLSEGDRIVAEGAGRVRDGARVEPSAPAPAPAVAK
ncbi:MAG: efflux RND transporter periplasmic adaptor subunit [Deltaproteobacteria bacterium]|nr:efflux RND transporter periplasmic adaptor subunit [Deltaproteobacteria bacterium]